MQKQTVKIQYLEPNHISDNDIRYGTPNASGVDLRSSEDITLPSMIPVIVKTGIKVQLPDNMTMMVCSRSGLATKGIFVLNAPGIVDPDYRGEVGVILMNTQLQPVLIYKGDRIAQAVFVNHCNPMFIESHQLSETERGEGGFGSTGVK